MNGYIDVVNRLIEDHRVDPSALNNEALRKASKKGYLQVVIRLLNDSRVINKDVSSIIDKMSDEMFEGLVELSDIETLEILLMNTEGIRVELVKDKLNLMNKRVRRFGMMLRRFSGRRLRRCSNNLYNT